MRRFYLRHARFVHPRAHTAPLPLNGWPPIAPAGQKTPGETMTIRWNILIVGTLGTVLGFLLGGNAPLGNILWPPAHSDVQPEGANLALLIVMGVVEAVAFGAGCAF